METIVKEKQGSQPADNLAKGNQQTTQNKPDETRVETVTPSNDNGEPGPSSEKLSNTDQEPPEEKSSNVNQGPSVENL